MAKRLHIHRTFAPGEERCLDCDVKLVPGLLKDSPESNISPSSMAKQNYCCRACTLIKARKARMAKKALDKELDVLHKDMKAYAKQNGLTRLELREEHAKRQAARYAEQIKKGKKKFGKNYTPPRPGLPASFMHHNNKHNDLRLNRRKLTEAGAVDSALRRELQALELLNTEIDPSATCAQP